MADKKIKFITTEEQEEPGFQMTPMIDVVFQLLVFFMVISSTAMIEQVKDIKLPMADHSKSKETQLPGEAVINVKENGEIIVDGVTYEPEGLTQLFKKTREKGPVTILVRGDKEALYGRIMKIMSACAEADIWEVSFAAYREEK